jgi:uncharacterized protein
MLITPEELALHNITIDTAYPAGDLGSRGSSFYQVADLRLHALAALVGSEIRIRGHFGTRVELQCDRCAAAVEFPLEEDFDLSYRPVSEITRQGEVEIPADELEVGFYLGEGVEISDLMREQLTLALPTKVLCRPDCKGLCAACGADLNKENCQCIAARHDSPFAWLNNR